VTGAVSRFDRDPDALAWARSKVADAEARFREYASLAGRAGKPEEAKMWRDMASGLRYGLMGGGDGPLVAAFDERRAVLPPSGEGDRS
jgi:hypothetical protein